jgi:hypothetical protein
VVWVSEKTKKLRDAYGEGGKQGAYAAFPELRKDTIRHALTRYVLTEPMGEPTPIDREAIRRKIAEMPLSVVCDRLAKLVHGI